jgi:hypothetical protein
VSAVVTLQRIARVAASVALLWSTSACVQWPTERAYVSDLRPQLSFVIEDESLLTARVQVNGLDVGKAGDFVNGKAALRMLPGTNVIRVVDGTRVVAEERVYMADGVARSIVLK